MQLRMDAHKCMIEVIQGHKDYCVDEEESGDKKEEGEEEGEDKGGEDEGGVRGDREMEGEGQEDHNHWACLEYLKERIKLDQK